MQGEEIMDINLLEEFKKEYFGYDTAFEMSWFKFDKEGHLTVGVKRKSEDHDAFFLNVKRDENNNIIWY